MRTPEELLESGLKVISKAYLDYTVWGMLPLFSGGHDSYSACFVAKHHKKFRGNIYHIDTGIGSLATRKFVDEIGLEEQWNTVVLKSKNKKDTYESIVSKFGFPSYGLHNLTYNKLKERSVAQITKVRGIVLKGALWILISGARTSESIRRMGNTVPIQKVGNRLWVAPCHDWSVEEQREFMNYYRLSLNPVKTSILAMSGECFCGAFARPNELEMIKEVVPDVARKIISLSVLAEANGKPCKWGTHPNKDTSKIQPTGPMCIGCDHRVLGIRTDKPQ